ncbi:hypothetical protein [Homoserinibacter sp. YIM 151385]|uniref:hypothetical protein n=1 Tax=Homoserinibacter sp. YIM 151385 TaxID=2985506 RepID=UPI0022F09F11|nr:hypothetical protein [Homoserinibacter sp. YIM 151385]WBU37618.1 hypothetical protein OF852_11960 [Homoserinibacter sp. YIM 151385]
MGETTGTVLSRRMVIGGLAAIASSAGFLAASSSARADDLDLVLDDPLATDPVVEPMVKASSDWQDWACGA